MGQQQNSIRFGERFRQKFEGTRLEPVVEAVRRARWPKVWRVGRRDHEALMIALPLLLRRDSNCVDIGANQGDILEILTRQAPAGRHVAFEPLPHHAARLRARFPGVEVHELALSDSAGQTSFFHTLGDDAYSGLKRTEAGPKITGVRELPVTLARLDDVLPEQHRVDLVKIDVEGAELAVLRGARRLLRAQHPVVVFEFQKERAESYGDSPRPYFDLLVTELGYALFRITGAGPLSFEQFQQAYDTGECYNFLGRLW